MPKQDTTTGIDHGENYCYYYLHENGDLIHKRKHLQLKINQIMDFEESPFVKRFWILDLDRRLDLYHFLIAASMLGARKERIAELVLHWNITDDDAAEYCSRTGLCYENTGTQFAVHAPDSIDLHRYLHGYGISLFEAVCDFYSNRVTNKQ